MSTRKQSAKKSAELGPLYSVKPGSNLRIVAGIAVIAAALFVAYMPSINGDFIWDDHDLIVKNSHIPASDGLYRLWCTTEPIDYWPMTYSTFWLEWRLWSANSTGYHATNLLLHIVESLFIWLILRRLEIPGAFLAAMLFALHPVNVESVAWISQRKNLMAMLFFLLSILWYLKGVMPTRNSQGAMPTRSVGMPSGCTDGSMAPSMTSNDQVPSPFDSRPWPLIWYGLSLAAFILAMLSKGSVAVLPAILLLITWWLRPLNKWDLIKTLPFFLAAVVFAGVNVWFQTHGGAQVPVRYAGFLERLLDSGAVVWFYLYKSLWPLNLSFVYPQWDVPPGNPLWWLPLIAAVSVTIGLWFYRNTWARPLFLAWCFFCLALVPVMGFTDVSFMQYALVADHYLHIAIIGVLALLSAGFCTLQYRQQGALRWLSTSLVVVVLGALMFLSCRHNAKFVDEITLYQDTLAENPNCWMATNNLGCLLNEKGQPMQAIEYFERTIQLKPDHAEAHNNLGGTFYKLGRLQEASEHFQQALSIRPDFPEVYNNLGKMAVDAGQFEQAIKYYLQTLSFKSNYAESYANLAVVYAKMGQIQQAIESYQQAIKIDPNYADAHSNLGNLFSSTGHLSEAIGHFQQALRIKPTHIVHNNLANAFLKSGDLPQAIEHYEKALSLNADYPEAHNNLGFALYRTGRNKEAIEHYQQALNLKPDFTMAYYNLALAYAATHQTTEALDAAQKALELAQLQGQEAQVKKIEEWLNSYRAGLSDESNAPPSSKPATSIDKSQSH